MVPKRVAYNQDDAAHPAACNLGNKLPVLIYSKDDWFGDEVQERAPGTKSAGGGYEVDTTPTFYCKKYAFHTATL